MEKEIDRLIQYLELDIFSYFQCILPDQYDDYGIDPEDVSFGTMAALRHPPFLPSPLGGNAYGLGIFEHKFLKDEEIRFLHSIELDNPVALAKYTSRINELYRKMGLLIRISRSGMPYYLIPHSFISHSILDIRTRVNIIENVWKDLMAPTAMRIGIMTTPEDILYHELVARFPHHKFFVLQSIEDIIARKVKFDGIISPYNPIEYLKIVAAREQTLAGAFHINRIERNLCYLFSILRETISREGLLIMVLHAGTSKHEGLQKVTFIHSSYAALFKTFCQLHRGSTPLATISHNNNQMEAYLQKRDLQAFMKLAPVISSELQERFNKPIENISHKEIKELEVSKNSTFVRDEDVLLKKIKKSLTYFFNISLQQEVLPPEYEEVWKKRIRCEEIPPLFLVISARPKRPSITRPKLESFLKESKFSGCPVSLVASYKDSLAYILEVTDYLKKILSERYEGFPKEVNIRRFDSKLIQLVRCAKKLETIYNILDSGSLRKASTAFFENIPILSLMGLDEKNIKEMGLIVTGYSGMGRVMFGKYPLDALNPLLDMAYKDASIIDFVFIITLAQVSAALGRPLNSKEMERICTLRRILLKAQSGTESLKTTTEGEIGLLISKIFHRILLMMHCYDEKEFSSDLDSSVARSSREFLNNLFFNDRTFLTLFLKARFHGTSHILPRLGFYPSLMLLWGAVQAAHNASRNHSTQDKTITVDLNPILKNIPREHRRERVEHLKCNLENLLKKDVNTIKDDIARLYNDLSTSNKWFWANTGLLFRVNPLTNSSEVNFINLSESTKIIEDLIKHINSKEISQIPVSILKSAEEHFGILEHLKKYNRIKIGYKLETSLVKTIYDKLLSLEEAHTVLKVLCHQCPRIMNVLFPLLKSDHIDSISYTLKRLKAIKDKDRLNFQELSAFYTMAKQEFGPFSEERISLSRPQFEELIKMFNTVHSRFSVYQAFILAVMFQHIPKERREKSLNLLLRKLPKTHWEASRSFDKIRKNFLKISDNQHMLGLIHEGEIPLMFLERIAEETNKSLLEAMFLMNIISEEVRKKFLTTDTLDHFLAMRSNIHTLTSKKNWKDYIKELLEETGTSIPLESNGSPLKEIKEDIACYGAYLNARTSPATSYTLLKGRYLFSMNRLLKLFGFPMTEAKDAIRIWQGWSVFQLYQAKGIQGLSLKAFEQTTKKALNFLLDVLTIPKEDRYPMIYCLDELGMAAPLHSKTLPSLIKECQHLSRTR